MPTPNQLKKYWHAFWMNFNQVILEDCLDHEEKKKIREKIDYHRAKLISK